MLPRTLSQMDQPKSLRSEEHRLAKLSRIREPHVAPLNELVDAIREAEGLAAEVPYFDPADGGTNATCLFLFEAAGPGAVKSGFISRNNPDETAKNFFLLNAEAGLPRRQTVSWNIIPWYIGTGSKIRPASQHDLRRGLPYLDKLLAALPNLKVIVLAGRTAQRGEDRIRSLHYPAQIVKMMHPSPMVLNSKTYNRGAILATLRRVAKMLDAESLDSPDA